MSRICATPLQFETFVFKAISSCFPKQIGGHFLIHGHNNGWTRRKEYNSIYVSSVFNVVCEFLRFVFARKKGGLYLKKISKLTSFSFQ